VHRQHMTPPGARTDGMMRLVLPLTPPASDDRTRRAMQGNRRVDTTPEVQLRSLLHAEGLRFLKDCRVEGSDLTARVDIVFRRQRVAVFVDGCYWHGCPEHCRMPVRNADYWTAKIARNRARDRRVTAALTGTGWLVVRVWEHESVSGAACRVRDALSAS
jgi:DNA mismatch endonuclease (patch repair protein)